MKLKNFFGILLGLALMIGLMPGMSLTAHAATTYTANQNLSILYPDDILDATTTDITLTNNLGAKAYCAIADIRPTSKAGYTPVEQNGFFPLPGGKKYIVIQADTETDMNTDYTEHFYTFAEVKYPLWVGGTQVTSENASNIDGHNKASYNAETKTLTLNGFSSSTTYCPNPNSYFPINVVIYSTEDLTINLKGNNTITTETTDGYFGISMANWKNLTIEGTGSLNATGYNGISTGSSSLRIKGGRLYIYGSNYGINCNNSSTGSGSESVIISGGNVEIEGGEAGLASSGYISVTGGTVHIHATGASKKAINNEIRVGSVVVGSQSTDGSNWGALENSQDGRYVVSSGYSYAKFEAEKSAATVTTAPEALNLTYSGSAQKLVTAGTATGGEMQYALGTSAEATQSYTTDIPTGTNAGTYYVWYKAKGDASHSDSIPGVVSVTIKEKTDPHKHSIKKVDALDPTCTENGYKAHYECTECDKWFADASGSVEITDKTSFIIDATGHKWDDGVVTKEATYDETGIKTFTCENDPSHTKEEEIPRKVYYERESDTDNSDGSSGSSGGGSGKNSGSVSKQSIDVNGNTISSNHQAESGLPASDVGGNWGNNAEIWTYTKSDGTVAKAEWMNLDYNGLRYWYYFDSNGIMQTNWFDYNNERFYLMPEKDGWRGRMATGWKNIENKWYYFETVPGSSQGRLYRSTVTPDGHTVGADGAWNGVGETPVGQK